MVKIEVEKPAMMMRRQLGHRGSRETHVHANNNIRKSCRNHVNLEAECEQWVQL